MSFVLVKLSNFWKKKTKYYWILLSVIRLVLCMQGFMNVKELLEMLIF